MKDLLGIWSLRVRTRKLLESSRMSTVCKNTCYIWLILANFQNWRATRRIRPSRCCHCPCFQLAMVLNRYSIRHATPEQINGKPVEVWAEFRRVARARATLGRAVARTRPSCQRRRGQARMHSRRPPKRPSLWNHNRILLRT